MKYTLAIYMNNGAFYLHYYDDMGEVSRVVLALSAALKRVPPTDKVFAHFNSFPIKPSQILYFTLTGQRNEST